MKSESGKFMLYLSKLTLAAVSRVPGEPLVIEEIFVATPMPREVRIRIICTSPSNTDVAFWKMKVLFSLILLIFLFSWL